MEFNKIMVPVDGSYISEVAAEVAIHSAGTFGAHLSFVFIVDISLYKHSISAENDRMILAEEGRMTLERISKHAKEKGCDFETLIYEGVPHDIISELSKKQDMVIMAIKGKSGSKILGSTAEKVIENSFCPVLTLKSTSDRIENILLPVSDNHDSAIDLAINTVLKVKGKLTVLSVGDASAKTVVSEVAAKCRSAGIEVEELVAEGDPVNVICAQSGRFDLVIMGTEGKKGLKKILNGSVAEKVMVEASCPVTIIRKKD